MPLQKPPSPLERAFILLVDDNKHGLAVRKSVLEEMGHTVTLASSGAEALEQFAHQKFDMVITDYKMPRMDGLELIAELRELTPELPIILVSGFVDALGLNEQNTRADAVIQKSANEVSHLQRAVGRLLSRKPPKKPAQNKAAAAKASSSGSGHKML